MPNRPNLARMYKDLTEVYWLEAACNRVDNGHGPYKCYELLHNREGKLCPSCYGFVRLQESRRLALGEVDDRRKQSKEVGRLQ